MTERIDTLASRLDAILAQFDNLTVEDVQDMTGDLEATIREMDIPELERSSTTLRDASNAAQSHVYDAEGKRNAVNGLGSLARNRLEALRRAREQGSVQ